jgi:hypothetical protein
VLNISLYFSTVNLHGTFEVDIFLQASMGCSLCQNMWFSVFDSSAFRWLLRPTIANDVLDDVASEGALLDHVKSSP